MWYPSVINSEINITINETTPTIVKITDFPISWKFGFKYSLRYYSIVFVLNGYSQS